MSKSKKALQPFWARMFQDYSNHVKHLQSRNPTWEQMVELERYRRALLDFRFNRKCSTRREGIRQKEMQKYMASQKTKNIPYAKRRLPTFINSFPLARNVVPRVPELPAPLPSLIPARKLLQLNNRIVRSLSYHSTASDRLKELAKSKPRSTLSEVKPWKLTTAMRNFEPSDRLLSLASHRKCFKARDPFKVSTSALLYNATPRILLLAEPYKRNQEDQLINPPRPECKGTTQRIRDLAKPRLREDNVYRRTPFKVSDRALRSKLTPRLLELAEPRM